MKKILCVLTTLIISLSITSPVMALEENSPIVDNKFIFESENNASLNRDVFGSALLLGNNVNVNKKVDGIGLFGGNKDRKSVV